MPRYGHSRSNFRLRGRKTVVSRFTNRNGLWILAVVAGIMLAILLMWKIGVVRLDLD